MKIASLLGEDGGGGGGGNVTGPITSTDNAVARFNGTSGNIIQNSGVIIDDSNNITAPNGIALGADATLGTVGGTYKIWNIADTVTDFSATVQYPFLAAIEFAPTGALTDVTIAGYEFTTTVPASNTHDITAYNFSALEGVWNNDGTGDVNIGFGIFGAAYNNGTGDITSELVAGYFFASNYGAGNISGTAQKDGNFAVAAGTGNYSTGIIQRNFHFYAETPYGTGEIKNNWGIYLEDQSVGTTDSWAIQTAGGKVEFGAPTGKSSKLLMTGADISQPSSFLPSNAYLQITPFTATGGGSLILSASDGDSQPLRIYSIFGTNNPTDSTPAIDLVGVKSDGGSGVTSLGSTETLLRVLNNNSTVISVLGSGVATFHSGLVSTTTATFTGANVAGGSGTGIAISPTLLIMDGSDNYDALKISITNANHTGSGNTIQGITIDGITFDANETATAIKIGSGGWNYGMSLPDNIGILFGSVTEVYDGTNLAFTGGVVSFADITSPGSGTNSEHYGASSTASGNDTVALGNDTQASGNDSVVIGQNSSTSNVATQTIVIGNDINTTSSGGVTIGYSATNYANGVSIGSGANSGSSAVAVGRNSGSGGTGCVIVGESASGNGTNNIAIGRSASATGSGGATESIAIGASAATGFTQVIAIGGGAAATAANQLLLGGANTSISNVFIGNGVTSATPSNVALRVTGGSTTGVNGASLTIAGGLGGAAADKGGDLLFQTAKTGTGTTLATRFQISEDKIGFFGVTAAVQQTGGAATAGVAYTATEQSMLQKAYDTLRTFGFLT